MPEVLDRAKLTGILTSNVVLVLAGIGIASYGLVKNLATRKRLPQREAATTLTSSGVVNLCLGSVNIAVGSYGLVCSLIHNRGAIIANVVLLAISSLGQVVFLATYALEVNQFISNEQLEIRVALVRAYGSDATRSSRRFTEAIDLIQRTYSCCDWGGDTQGNIYFKTPWYQQRSPSMNNASTTARMVFPESCCVRQGPDCSASPEVQSLARARKQGAVHAKDCLHVIVARFKFYARVVMLLCTLGILIQFQVWCAIPPALYILANTKS